MEPAFTPSQVNTLRSEIHHQAVALQRPPWQRSQLLMPPRSVVGRPRRFRHDVANSTTKAAFSAISHDLLMTLTSPLSLGSSQGVSQTERCGFAILYTTVYLTCSGFPKKLKLEGQHFRDQSWRPEAKRCRVPILRTFFNIARIFRPPCKYHGNKHGEINKHGENLLRHMTARMSARRSTLKNVHDIEINWIAPWSQLIGHLHLSTRIRHLTYGPCTTICSFTFRAITFFSWRIETWNLDGRDRLVKIRR